ncbi:unnamed protein product [Cyprideis torosa]|uniref:IQ motif and ubiquitin-like domain-containing protein n=1 Tax=Cyprideis torosa TaxID=163714 RepID=A0A7R8WJG7_9CRUS|nr:unnamed protein product [Cyprideis torosa]CAG0900140.1 unnamed protein product [Cyprideis torosa]
MGTGQRRERVSLPRQQNPTFQPKHHQSIEKRLHNVLLQYKVKLSSFSEFLEMHEPENEGDIERLKESETASSTGAGQGEVEDEGESNVGLLSEEKNTTDASVEANEADDDQGKEESGTDEKSTVERDAVDHKTGLEDGEESAAVNGNGDGEDWESALDDPDDEDKTNYPDPENLEEREGPIVDNEGDEEGDGETKDKKDESNGEEEDDKVLEENEDGGDEEEKNKDDKENSQEIGIESWRSSSGLGFQKTRTVKVVRNDGSIKLMTLEVLREDFRKPFLGGYKNTKTLLEYHHASSQTPRKSRGKQGDRRNVGRSTQTFQVDQATQMTRMGYWESSGKDKELAPRTGLEERKGTKTGRKQRPKHTQLTDKQLAKHAIVIQRAWRSHAAHQPMTAQSLERDDGELEAEFEEEQRPPSVEGKIKEVQEEEALHAIQRLEDHIKEILASGRDLRDLPDLLKRWRKEQLHIVHLSRSGAERHAAYCIIQDQEAKWIFAYNQWKILINKRHKDRELKDLLDQSSEPLCWISDATGHTLEADTPDSQTGKDLKQAYDIFIAKGKPSREETLRNLRDLYNLLSCHRESVLSMEIKSLICRHMDLVLRGVQTSQLQGLRQRILLLFQEYIKDPFHNPRIKLIRNNKNAVALSVAKAGKLHTKELLKGRHLQDK